MDDQGHMDFDQFMAPFTPVLQHLQAFLSSPAHANPGPARDEARGLLMGVLRDLRGVCVGTPNRRAYVAFFDWLYPDYLPMFVLAAEIWWNDAAVTTPLLKVRIDGLRARSLSACLRLVQSVMHAASCRRTCPRRARSLCTRVDSLGVLGGGA